MKKIFLCFGLLFILSASRAQNDIVVDPNASVRSLTGSFNAIKVSNGIDIYLSQSDQIAIAVSAADEKIKAGIKTVIEQGELKVYYDGEKLWNKKDRKLRVYISFTDLKKIDASGACDIVIAGSLSTDVLDLEMSGACDFSGLVKLNKLKVSLSGASDIRISGTAGTVDIECSGASDFKGFQLVTDYCKVNAAGASDIKVTVNRELTAVANGASDIKYKGAAVIKEMHKRGSSSISKVN